MRQDKIRDVRDWQADLRLFTALEAKKLTRRGARIPQPGGPKGDQVSQITVEARVNTGSWKADCPYCNSVELVQLDDPVFYCLNPECPRPEGHKWLGVEFPSETDRLALEEELLKLPFGNEGEHRFWRPGTEVNDLQARAAHVRGDM
jgi:hypothetical protein